jgi:hypothetical protein
MKTHMQAIAPVSPVAPQRLPWWKSFAEAWDRFFFRPGDPTTLGMMRICCGLIAVYTLIAFTWDLQNFFGEHAYLDLEERNAWRKEYPQTGLSGFQSPEPQEDRYFKKWGISKNMTSGQGMPIWSLWFHITEPTAMAITHWTIIGVTFLFTIGFCTRLTSALAWFGSLSYIHRSNFTVFGVDTMMTIALFYLMIGPSGAALSVDRLLKRWWLTFRALRRGGHGESRLPPGAEPTARLPALAVTPSVSANLAIRLFQIHTCIIYMSAGLSKLLGQSWWTGEAIWGTISELEFAPLQYGWYRAFLTFLCEHEWLWYLFMTGGTLFTLAFEIGFAFLVWGPRTRWVIIAMAVTLHGGIGMFMGLKTFSFMMLTLVMSFVPPEVIHRFLRALARGPTGLKLYYPVYLRKSVRAASVVHALDVWNQVELVGQVRKEGQPAHLVLETSQGESLSGMALKFRLIRILGIFRIFFPWNWLAVFRRTKEPFPEAPLPEAAGPAEVPGRWEEEVEVGPKGITAVKQKR